MKPFVLKAIQRSEVALIELVPKKGWRYYSRREQWKIDGRFFRTKDHAISAAIEAGFTIRR